MTPRELQKAAEADLARADRLLEIAHVAIRLHVCHETVRRYIRAGKLVASRAGTADNQPWRVLESDLTAFLRRAKDFSLVRLQQGSKFVDRCGVYFVAGHELVKIGCAKNVLARFSTLEASSPVALTMLGWIPTPENDRLSVEVAAHEHFGAVRVRGEWFNIDHESALAYVYAHDGLRGRPISKLHFDDVQPLDGVSVQQVATTNP